MTGLVEYCACPHCYNSRFYITKIQHEVVYLINVITKLSNKQYKL